MAIREEVIVPSKIRFARPRLWTPERCAPFDTPFRPAEVIHIADADTIDLELDLGFDTKRKIRTRLTGESWLSTNRKIGFNAWETRGEERERGLAATERVEALTPEGSGVLVRSWLGGARGSMYRWLCMILVRCESLSDGLYRTTKEVAEPGEVIGWYSLADILLHEGHGREWWRGWKRGKARPEVKE